MGSGGCGDTHRGPIPQPQGAGPYQRGAAGAGGDKPWQRRGRSGGRGQGAGGPGAAPRRGQPASDPPRGAGAGGAGGSRAGCRPGPRGTPAAAAPAPRAPCAGAGPPARSLPAPERHGQCGQEQGQGRGDGGHGGHGTYPVEVEVGLPAVPPEEDGGLGVGASDGLPADEEPHHRAQHQRHVQRPEGQCGPQPLRPPPWVLCAGMGSATPRQCCPVPTPGSPSSGLHPTCTKEPPPSCAHPNRFHPNGLCLTHTPGYPFWWPSPCAHPSKIYPMASAPCPPQSSPISDLPWDPHPDGLHPLSTMITSTVMVTTPMPLIPTVFTSCQPQQP